MATLDEVLGRRVSMASLSLLRVLAGPIVLVHLWPFLADARDGRIYRDTFYEPYWSWYPELPRALYVAVLCAGAVAAVGMSLGIRPRASTAITFGVVAYNLFLSTTHFHNNRAYLFIVLGGLALASVGSGPAWPLWTLRIEAAVVYGASGVSKLVDPDWFGGTVTWGRVVRVEERLPSWAASTLTARSFHTGAAKVIVLTEVFIAVGLLARRLRYAAVWVAVGFHAAIAVTADVQVFSVLGVAALVIWAVPSTGDRLLVFDADHERLAGVVGALDWLHRFRIERGDSFYVVDRDGARADGRAAVALAFSRLPLTAWFALPFTALAAARASTRRRSTCVSRTTSS